LWSVLFAGFAAINGVARVDAAGNDIYVPIKGCA
jgi:hypothetical protein